MAYIIMRVCTTYSQNTDVVGRGSETQREVGENLNDLTKRFTG